MANHTAAERERINKKHKRERIVIEVACVLAIAVFIFVCERKQWFSDRSNGSRIEAEATEQPDMRIEYLNKLGISEYTENGEDICVGISDENGDAQLIVSSANGPVDVTYVRSFEPYKHSGADTDVFPNIDDYFDDGEEIDALCTGLCDELYKYLEPLGGNGGGGGLAEKLRTSLYPICEGTSQQGGFLLGIYTVDIIYSQEGGTLRVEAKPAY